MKETTQNDFYMLWALEFIWIAKANCFRYASYVIDSFTATNRAYNLLPGVDKFLANKTFNLKLITPTQNK